MAIEIQLKRGVAANWTSLNPILAQGEIGYETNTNKFKIGDGATAWSGLSYFASGSGLSTTAWETSTTYIEDSIVGYGGKIYISLQNNNLGKDPVTEPTWWEEFSSGGAAALVDLTDVDDTNIAIGKMLQVGADGITHEYVDPPTGGGSDTAQTLTFATTITPDIDDGNIMTVTLTNDCTFNIPSNLTAGQLFEVRRIQSDTTPYTITWGTGYLTPGGVNIVQSGKLSSIDRYMWRAISTTEAELIGAVYDLKAIV